MIDVFGDRISINGEELYPVIIDSFIVPGSFITKTARVYSAIKNVRIPTKSRGYMSVVDLSCMKERKPPKYYMNKMGKILYEFSVPSDWEGLDKWKQENQRVHRLTKEGKEIKRKARIHKLLHQVMMQTFKPIDKYPPDRLKDCWKDIPEQAKQWIRETAIINHKDHNPLNCLLDNLEWVTFRENTQKSVDYYGGV